MSTSGSFDDMANLAVVFDGGRTFRQSIDTVEAAEKDLLQI
jgi:hypothetical protein